VKKDFHLFIACLLLSRCASRGQVGVDAAPFAQYAWEGRTIEAHLAQIREFRRADEEALLDWLCAEIFDHEQHPERLRELIRAECRTRAIQAPAEIAALIDTG
jgi:hypothetical protein